MGRGYEALTAKVKAMYGKRLKYADYTRLAHLGSVGELYEDLRQHPVWGTAMGRLSDLNYYSRAKLEAALREVLRREYVRLSAFIPQKDRALMEFPVLRAEVDGLLYNLARLRAGRVMEPDTLPPSFIRHSKTDENALYTCSSYEGLLESTRESIFYKPLLSLRKAPGEVPDYAQAEPLLFSVYYGHVMDVVKKRYDGDAKALLGRDIGTRVDLLNIMHILRLKHYFPQEDNLWTALYPFYYKLKPAQVHAMCDAGNAQAAMEVVKGTPYAGIFQGASMEDLDRIYCQTLCRLSRRQVMMGQPSIYTAVAFLNLRELETKELIRVAETVKYHAPYDDQAAADLGK